MTDKKENSKKQVKATQIAFELEQVIAKKIQKMAIKEGLATSSQIRKLIGLEFSPPKRPRLTISLSENDYEILSKKYNIDKSDTIGIKRMIMAELIKITEEE